MRQSKTPFIKIILWLFSLIIAVGLFRSVISHFFRIDVVEEHKLALQREEKRNSELRARLKEATGAAFIEKQAREKLGFAKEGDTIVLLQTPASAVVGSDSKEQHLSRWERWWGLFF